MNVVLVSLCGRFGRHSLGLQARCSSRQIMSVLFADRQASIYREDSDTAAGVDCVVINMTTGIMTLGGRSDTSLCSRTASFTDHDHMRRHRPTTD